jgi:GcrA cell cycle regulator
MPPGAAFFEPPIDESIPMEQRRSLIDLEPGMCNWPVGDPSSTGLFFCGGVTSGKREPYCIAHSRVAFCGAEHRVDPTAVYRPRSLQLTHHR